METINLNDHGIGRKFKTMAEGRNFIQKTNIYTSKLKPEDGKQYYGRGKGDMGNGGFLDNDGIWNQFVQIGKTDVGYRNEYHPELRNGVWIERCVFTDEDKRNEWAESRGAETPYVRVFLKHPDDKEYTCKGIFKYTFTDKTKPAVIWNKI